MLDAERRTPVSGKIVPGTNNVPTSFDTTAGSLLISNVTLAKNLKISNTAGGRLKINYQGSSSASAPTTVLAYIESNENKTWNDIQLGSFVYVASDTGSALTTGAVTGEVW